MIFVIAPDSLSAREVLRHLGRQGTVGVQVGGFRRLLETLQELYVLPEPADVWDETLRAAALRAENVFWSRSIQLNESAVLHELDTSLRSLLDAVSLVDGLPDLPGGESGGGPGGEPDAESDVPMPRWQQRYRDLLQLHGSMQGIRPHEQEMARQWYAVRSGPHIEDISILNLLDNDELPVWKRELLQALPTADSPEITALLQQLSGHDRSFPQERWVTCRDRVEETQAAVSMLQQAVQRGIHPDRMAVVYPHGSDYPRWLVQSLRESGLAVQNLQEQSQTYDWQAELIRDLLTVCKNHDCLEPMLFMSILANPLMPWSAAYGQYLAGEYAEALAFGTLNNSQLPEHGSSDVLRILARPLPENSSQLIRWIDEVITQTDSKPQYGLTVEHARRLIAELRILSELYVSDGFQEQLQKILNQWQAGNIARERSVRTDLNGVYFLSTQEALLTPVDEMICLGFNAGSWGASLPASGVFDYRDWDALAEAIALPLTNADELRRRWDNRFTRLIGQASCRCTYLLSRQNLDGGLCQPSEYLLDCAARLQLPGQIVPDQLIEDIRTTDHDLIQLKTVPATPGPAGSQPDHLEFGRSVFELIALRPSSRKPGSDRKPDRDPAVIYSSPSKLETMMVSPLVWLLEQIEIKSRCWGALELDVMLQGTVAHQVFERYLTPSADGRFPAPPTEQKIAALLEAILKERAPFLLYSRWRFARIQLQQEVYTALTALHAWLQDSGMSVLHTELKLRGELWNMHLGGFADVVLLDASGRTAYIIDYKKSKSQDRSKRLQQGFDLQTCIYRELFRQESSAFQNIVTGYFTMHDTTLILDTPVDSSPYITITYPDISQDAQSQQARAYIVERIDELQRGIVTLNTNADSSYWEKQGVGRYALDNRIAARFTREMQ